MREQFESGPNTTSGRDPLLDSRGKGEPDPFNYTAKCVHARPDTTPLLLAKQEGDSRLRRRLLALEKLDVAEKRQVLTLIDAFIERGQLKRKVQGKQVA